MKKKITRPLSISGKHVPLRTCAGCRQVKSKLELIRLIRIPNGDIEIDSSGRKSGRGVYLCPARECWETGLKGDRLGYALHGRLGDDNRKRLILQAEQFLKGAN
jgi:predicted RNA-binding protein YlxR (DUF448 family)